MRSLQGNIIANYLGQSAAVLIGFVVVPLYIRLIGVDGYGIVGFLVSLQAILGVLDLGLGLTANREVGRLLNERQGIADLIHTLEWVYGVVGAVIILGVFVSSSFLATSWISSRALPDSTIRLCVIVAGIIIGLRWPLTLYNGVMRGAEQQVLLNTLAAFFTLLRASLALAGMSWVSATVEMYYSTQLLVSVIEIFVFRFYCRRGLALIGVRGAFSWPLLKNVWGFSWRLAGISLCAVLLKQIDRVLIARLLTLSDLGFYTVATVLGVGLSKVYTPVQTAVFPRINRLLAVNDEAELAAVFHRACQLVSVITAPFAGLCVFYAQEILLLWTGDPAVAANAAMPLRVYALAMWLNSMMSIPYMLQVAKGMTWLPLRTNVIGLCLLGPAIGLFVRWLGLPGAALGWLAYNVFYVAVVPNIMFKYILAKERASWYWHDNLGVMACGLVAFGFWRAAHAPIGGSGALLLSAGAALVTYSGLILLCYPLLRKLIFCKIKQII